MSKGMIAGKIVQWLLVTAVACADVFLVVSNLTQPVETDKITVSENSVQQSVSSKTQVSYPEREYDAYYEAYAQRILDSCGENAATDQILYYIEQYPQELLDWVIQKPDVAEFVSNSIFSCQYGYDYCEKIDLSEDYVPGAISLLMQWDTRWGYETYGSDLMAYNACGPTCFAMVYVGLTGDTSVNPLTIAKMCMEKGYYHYGSGTGGELFRQGVLSFGLRSKALSFNSSAVLKSLNAGRPVVASVGRGDFTSSGHYIVLTGVTEEGNIRVHDPNSYENSQKSWEPDRILRQVNALWSVWKE